MREVRQAIVAELERLDRATLKALLAVVRLAALGGEQAGTKPRAQARAPRAKRRRGHERNR